MALSNCTPLSPITCTSEITDKTSAAASTQRGQFFRRWAASQTRNTSSRIMPPAITVATMIMDSVISPPGVRSWNATDSASSVSDRYSSTSNHCTFLGTFIASRSFLIISRSFPGELESHLAVAVGIVAPVFAHLDEQEQMHGHAHDLGQFLARLRADRLDGGAALAEHDLALAFALDKDRLLDTDRFVLALGPAVGLDGGLIRQLLVQLAVDLFPGDLGRQMSLRREDPGRIDQNDLRIVFDHDTADQRARGLHLARDDRDLGADQRVDQRGLADIGSADQRDKAATRGGRDTVFGIIRNCCPRRRLRARSSRTPRPFPRRACCRRCLRPAPARADPRRHETADRDAAR